MTPTFVCNMMNKVYDKLKEMSVQQIEEAKSLAEIKLTDEKHLVLFIHQCNYAIEKKMSGKW
jgi:hypothetical protein